MKIKYSVEQAGQGPLTVDALMTLATELHDKAPHEAQVHIRTETDQREHDEFWRATTTWEEETT